MLFADTAMAQTTAPGGASEGGIMSLLAGPLPLMVGMFAIFYFLMLRPQQQRMKQHQAMVAALKRGDTVVLASGMIGKVTKVDDAEVSVEIAPTVNVKVVKSTISEVRAKGEPAPANDAKS